MGSRHDNGANGNEEDEKIMDAIRLRESRREDWRKQGEWSVWQNLSMIGALGWLIIVPTLLGVVSGRLLDKALGSGIFWTASLIFLGVSFGSFLAWRKVSGR